eukprot:Hpha_TRINITY_DN6240_c0_g1::TRINITY_DN6240_c0_g1_i1::g.23728::m.23728
MVASGYIDTAAGFSGEINKVYTNGALVSVTVQRTEPPAAPPPAGGAPAGVGAAPPPPGNRQIAPSASATVIRLPASTSRQPSAAGPVPGQLLAPPSGPALPPGVAMAQPKHKHAQGRR